MSPGELVLIAVGLSMDAFAVSVGKGLTQPVLKVRHALLAGLYFGGFQFLMPLAGYLLGRQLAGFIRSIDHWVAFAILAAIGIHMMRDSFRNEGETDGTFAVRQMLVLAVATSIDAFAVGVSFAFLETAMLPSVAVIGITTFLISAAGVLIGHFLGTRLKKGAGLAGGIILTAMGIRILVTHLMTGT